MAPNVSLNTSNYISEAENLESMNTVRVSADVPILEGGIFSVDVGADVSLNHTESGMQTNVVPAFEAKYRQTFARIPIGKTEVNLTGFVRYNNIGGSNILKTAGGFNIPVSKKTSIYMDVFYTEKFGEGSNNAGFWVGANSKINDKLSWWIEPLQMNYNLDGSGKTTTLMNVGLKYTF